MALRGPEGKAARVKTIRRLSFIGPGGQAILFPGADGIWCRGARPGARWARLILRKHRGTSGGNSLPADVFCERRSSLRAAQRL